MLVDDLLKKSQNGEPFSRDEIVQMLSYEPDSPESYRIMGEANRISKELAGNRAEVHAQFALNLTPCPCNCAFCSFARINGVNRMGA
jgi:biotin synthase